MVGAALLGAVTESDGQTVTASITNNFDAANSASGWTYWYDIYAPPYNSVILDWSSTVNNGGAAGSGSLVFSNGWPGVAVGNGHGQNQIWGTFAHSGGSQYDFSQTVDGSKYDSISFDIRANPDAPLNAQSNLVQLTVGFFTSNYQVHGTTNVNIPPSATNGWYHVVALVNKSDPALSTPAAGWAFNVNCYNNINGSLFTNTTPTILYIDNIQANRSKEPLRPPTMSSIISEPAGGLNLFSSSGSSDQYQRTNIKLISTIGVGWLGQTNVTYSFTIKNFPSVTNYPGYQAHIFLTTGGAGNNAGLDYGDPNLIFLDVKQNANGTASGTFRFKTNQPNGNTMVYGAGTLGSVGSTNVLGTWSLTFNQDTNITVTSPDGSKGTTNITADAAALFAEPLNVVFGGQPNNAANIGQAVILANASVTNAGTATSIANDNFLADTALDTATWSALSTAPNTVLVFPPDPGQKLVAWSLPDAGFGLQVTTNPANPSAWATLTGSEYFGPPLLIFPTSTSRSALVPSVYLGPKQNFFRLFTRRFTKLQVLMPGETAAPGTVTGKTGTPDPQSIGNQLTVTVNAVDANWNLATTGTDTVHLTSSAGTVTLPADGPLVGGTRNFNVTITAAGTFTITASDVDDPSKTANTGSPTTAN